jgi:hypothetical protein
MRTKKIKVHGVSIDVDETATHWVVYASPGIELQAQGITPLRAKRAKCLCGTANARIPSVSSAGTCRYGDCRGWTVFGVTTYMAKLLRSYPKVTVEVPVTPKPRRKPGQRMPGELRWAGQERGWVAA